MSYLFAFLIALATKYAAVFLVQILIRQYVWENWVKVYFAWAKFLHRMNLLLLMRFWIDRVCFLSITPRLGLPFLSPKCFLEKRWRVLTSEIISGCLVLKLWGTRKITLIAMRMNGNSVLIFFYISYIMKPNIIEKLWLTESRSVLLWRQRFRIRAHKNSPADAILNRIFQQIISYFCR